MPDTDVRLSRRTLTAAAGLAAGSIVSGVGPGFAQTPEASPSAVPAIDQIAHYVELRDDLIARGRPFIEALVTGENAAFAAQLSPELAELIGGIGASEYMALVQTNRLDLILSRLSIRIIAHYEGTGTISGFFHQGGSMPLRLDTDEPQGGDVPSGVWTGTIGPGTLDLGIEITFSGTADALEATLSVPSQTISDLPFDSATFTPVQQLGSMLDEEGMPVKPAGNLYRAAYAWGDAILVFNAGSADDGTWNSLQLQAAISLPPDPAEGIVPAGEYRLPADAQMLVGWGGDSEFRNHHAATPAQRHANDILMWRDGGTCPEAAGLANEDYFIWGLPLVAPAAGTVVGLINDLPDILPAINPDSAASMPSGPVHPAGNHVVIEVAESEYVLIGHMQQGSVVVTLGDEVQAGDPIGLAGNSGNTTEPHIHIHVQTTADLLDPAAIGLPLAFRDVLVDGAPVEEAVATQGTFIEPA